MHPPDEDCFDHHFKSCIEELCREDRRVALLIGSDVGTHIIKKPISSVTGLEVRGGWIPRKVKAVAMVNPAVALKRPLGEVRFAVENFERITRNRR
jgi:hypothetical protein